MMLVASQLEHWREQPRQVPLGDTTNPFLQAVQAPAVQLRQFRGQSTQEVEAKYCPGRQFWQLVAVPLQVRQVASH